MDAATIDRVARFLAGSAARRGVLRGLGGITVATVMGTVLPRGAAASIKTCKRKEKRCIKRCRNRHEGGIFGCRFNCDRYCGL